MQYELAGEEWVATSSTRNWAPARQPDSSQRLPIPAAFFVIGNAKQCIYAAMQSANCCYANKSVVTGIWYT